MIMRKYLVNLIFLGFFTIHAYGQSVQVVEVNPNYEKQNGLNEFHFIDKKFDCSGSLEVAKLTGTTENKGQNNLVQLFYSFKKYANELGANAFLINEFTIGSNESSSIVTVTAYYLTHREIVLNTDLFARNMVYVIGDVNANKENGKKIKFNSQKIQLMPLEYISYQNEIGKDAILSIGGFLGAKIWIHGKEDRLPEFRSLKGFGVGAGSNVNLQPSVSINTGRIYPVNLNLGLFLINIFNKKIY